MKKFFISLLAVLALTACETNRVVIDNPQVLTIDQMHFDHRHGCRIRYRAWSSDGKEYKIYSNTSYPVGTRIVVNNRCTIYK